MNINFFFMNINFFNQTSIYIYDFLWTTYQLIPGFYWLLLLLVIVYNTSQLKKVYFYFFLLLFYYICLFNVFDFLIYDLELINMNFLFNEINLFLLNSLNKWHPIFFYISTVFFFIVLYINYKLLLHSGYSLFSFLFYNFKSASLNVLVLLIFAIFCGSWWALQEASWGGWWNWDPSEFLGLILIIIYVIFIHFKLKVIYLFKYFFLTHYLFLTFINIFIFIQLNFSLVIHNFGLKFFFFFDNNLILLEWFYIFNLYYLILICFYSLVSMFIYFFIKPLCLTSIANYKYFFLILMVIYLILLTAQSFNNLLIFFFWNFFSILLTKIVLVWFFYSLIFFYFLWFIYVYKFNYILILTLLPYFFLQYCFFFTINLFKNIFTTAHWVLFFFFFLLINFNNLTGILFFTVPTYTTYLFLNDFIVFWPLKQYVLDNFFYTLHISYFYNINLDASLGINQTLLYNLALTLCLFFTSTSFLNIIYLNNVLPIKIILIVIFEIQWLFIVFFSYLCLLLLSYNTLVALD